MNYIKSILVAGVIASVATTNAYAGPYGDSLSKCLVEVSSQRDRVNLVKWVFLALAAHPAVKEFATTSGKQSGEVNKNMADLMTDLLTKRCATETKAAIKYEGPVALQLSFGLLGKVATRELFRHKAVKAELAGLTKYLNKNKFEQLLQKK